MKTQMATPLVMQSAVLQDVHNLEGLSLTAPTAMMIRITAENYVLLAWRNLMPRKIAPMTRTMTAIRWWMYSIRIAHLSAEIPTVQVSRPKTIVLPIAVSPLVKNAQEETVVLKIVRDRIATSLVHRQPVIATSIVAT